MIIEFKILKEKNISEIRNIDRSDVVTGIYKIIDNKLTLVNELFDHQGFSDSEYDLRVSRLTKRLKNGAIFIGAYVDEVLVGISGFTTDKVKDYNNMFNFGPLWIDKNHRRKGIARKLIELTIDNAKTYGIDTFYISATSSKNTISFYQSIGCKLIKPDRELFNLEPCDIHFKLLFSDFKKSS